MDYLIVEIDLTINHKETEIQMNDEVKMSVKDSLELMEKLMDMIKMTKEYAELLEKRIALLEKGEN